MRLCRSQQCGCWPSLILTTMHRQLLIRAASFCYARRLHRRRRPTLTGCRRYVPWPALWPSSVFATFACHHSRLLHASYCCLHHPSPSHPQVRTLASLSASPVSAVAIAASAEAMATLERLISTDGAQARNAALSTLANLSALGALPIEVLASPTLLSTLAAVARDDALPEASPPPSSPTSECRPPVRVAALVCLSQAARNESCRAELARLGAPATLAAAISSGGEAAVHATHAIAYLVREPRSNRGTVTNP